VFIPHRIYTHQSGQHIGERVRLAGWLHRHRQLSRVSFVILRDRGGLIQIVLEDAAQIAQIARLYHESVIAVEGIVVAQPSAPGGLEIHQPTIEVISPAADPPPFDLFRPTIQAALPTLLDHAALGLRHPRQRARFEIAAASMTGFRSALDAADFTEIQTPKIVGSATESGANVFRIDYFGRPAYLAQSPQFYKQIMVGIYERVYEIGPVFRAEPHDTPRHLNEYVSMDAEMGFITDHTTVMAVLRRVIAGMISAVGERAAAAVRTLDLALPDVPATIPAVHFSEALDLIHRETGDDARAEPDLAPAHERWLGDWARREFGSDFLFVIGYPMIKRPFYTHPDPARPAYSNSFDLLFRGLELVTGGQRLHRYSDLRASLEARGMPCEPFAGYLDAFRFGMPPHGGFAIGLERWVARLTGADNIRETTLFPRDQTRLLP
jgi:nondiscriminating aspartyl-tRNA synthetase